LTVNNGKGETTMSDNKKPTFGYTVTHLEDGSVEVKTLEQEGLEKITNDKIYEDIVSLSKFIERQSQITVAYNAGYQAALKAIKDSQAKQEPTVVKPDPQ
jgi:hypothetical protein